MRSAMMKFDQHITLCARSEHSYKTHGYHLIHVQHVSSNGDRHASLTRSYNQ